MAFVGCCWGLWREEGGRDDASLSLSLALLLDSCFSLRLASSRFEGRGARGGVEALRVLVTRWGASEEGVAPSRERTGERESEGEERRLACQLERVVVVV
jgi:hypothetical protein